MLAFDERLKCKCRDLNTSLAQRTSILNGLQKPVLRNLLTQHVGRFGWLKKLDHQEIMDLTKGRPVVGVDGSSNSYGGSYPYLIYVFQAMAKSTQKLDGVDCVLSGDLFTPLLTKDNNKVKELREKTKFPLDQVMKKLKDERMATLEVEVAIEAIQKFQPSLVIFDGGFLRYSKDAGTVWESYKDLALKNGVLTVGVIEEVGTFELSASLGDSLPEITSETYDREILFNLLEPGEYLTIREDLALPKLKFEKKYYSCFVRPTGNPQAIACDFFREQMQWAEAILNYLYTITPSGSRGIPLWLDIVDAEIRIGHAEIELLLDTYLDPEVREKLLRPNRERRVY